jgi:hypothetical protein
VPLWAAGLQFRSIHPLMGRFNPRRELGRLLRLSRFQGMPEPGDIQDSSGTRESLKFLDSRMRGNDGLGIGGTLRHSGEGRNPASTRCRCVFGYGTMPDGPVASHYPGTPAARQVEVESPAVVAVQFGCILPAQRCQVLA